MPCSTEKSPDRLRTRTSFAQYGASIMNVYAISSMVTVYFSVFGESASYPAGCIAGVSRYRNCPITSTRRQELKNVAAATSKRANYQRTKRRHCVLCTPLGAQGSPGQCGMGSAAKHGAHPGPFLLSAHTCWASSFHLLAAKVHRISQCPPMWSIVSSVRRTLSRTWLVDGLPSSLNLGRAANIFTADSCV